MKSHLLRLLFAIAVICAPLFFVPETAHAQTYVTYTVQPGDTLSKIFRQYCTTWQTIYNINQQAIGPNPNNLTAGTVLTVPNNCSSGGGTLPPPTSSWPPGTERVQFAPGAIAASRTGTTGWGQPKYYVLTAMAGQNMELYTTSHGDPLTVSVTQPNNMNAALGGTNNNISNYLFMTLPMTGDYLITVTPAVMPESQTVPFDITFAIR